MNNITAYAHRAIQNSQEQIKIKYEKNNFKLGKFNIIYLNINSLRNKLDELEEIIHNLQNRNGKIIHFIVLTESRLRDEDTQYFNINNYASFHCVRRDGYGGCALFVHESITCNFIAKKSELNIELLAVNIIELSLNIIVVYKQPPVSTDTLVDVLLPFIENRGRCIALGDFNINLLSETNMINKYAHALISSGFSFLNKINQNAATRVAQREINGRTLTSSTIIDHAITNCVNYSFTLSLTDTPISDQKLMVITFDDCKKSNFIQLEKTVEYSVIDERGFNEDLTNLLNEPAYLEITAIGDFIASVEQIKANRTSTKSFTKKFNPMDNKRIFKYNSRKEKIFSIEKKIAVESVLN